MSTTTQTTYQPTDEELAVYRNQIAYDHSAEMVELAMRGVRGSKGSPFVTAAAGRVRDLLLEAPDVGDPKYAVADQVIAADDSDNEQARPLTVTKRYISGSGSYWCYSLSLRTCTGSHRYEFTEADIARKA